VSGQRGWIGVDLDGTLARYDGWKGAEHIGEPIIPMVRRVLDWYNAGIEVRIFTARCANGDPGVIAAIEAWCQEHLNRVLPITCQKDYGMIELWDDRCVQVIPNTGARADGAAE
jgi:hypothetical protein